MLGFRKTTQSASLQRFMQSFRFGQSSRNQGQLRREALRLHQRLVVDHDELALVLRKTRALWLPSSRSSGPLSGAALLLDTCSLLQPAQFFVKKRLSEKSEVLVTVSVLEAKSCGAETVPELVTSPQPRCPSTLRRSWP